jgi:hypothetical protein
MLLLPIRGISTLCACLRAVFVHLSTVEVLGPGMTMLHVDENEASKRSRGVAYLA